MAYQIVSVKEKALWNRYVQSCLEYDFYHTWSYHTLEKSGEPVLFVYQHQETIVVFPLLKRYIDGTKYSDFTSVYGFSGPISNIRFEDMDTETMEGFKDDFLDFLTFEQNISVFCRLHPMINHDILVERFGSLVNNGKTIAINLKTTLEVQRSKYRRQFRSKIRQLREQGFTLRVAENNAEVQAFVKIYRENMLRVHADSFYLFEEDYFFNMLNSDDFESSVLLLYVGEEISCGAFVTYSNEIMQFHLAATNSTYISKAPMKLLVDEATLVGREKGMKFLHLGGGVGGNEDSLYEFKAGFSDHVLNFKTWRYVSNQEAYDQLVNDRVETQTITTDFFPLYRDPTNY